MPLMTWKPEYSVGVQSFDAQHQKLIGLINDLHDARAQGRGAAATGVILTELIDYTVTHFSAEERAFATAGYPEIASHKALHVHLVRKVRALKEQVDAGNNALSSETFQFLKDWLANHILQVDKRYGPHLNSHGIE
jgi:hemerythrin